MIRPTTRTACVACGRADFETLLTPEDLIREAEWLESFHRRRHADRKDVVEFTQSDPVFVLRCTGCGTILRNPQPSPRALRDRYRCDHYGCETLERHLRRDLQFFQQKIATFSFLGHRARVLEIGSFVGGFLLVAREVGWDAVGVDIGRETCAFTRRLGLTVLEGDIRELQLAGSFDTAFVWNTFDQIDQPDQFLERIKSLLVSEGALILRVPNGDFETTCIRERQRNGNDQSILKIQARSNFLTFPYLTGYTPASLSLLLARHGFEVVSVQGDDIARPGIAEVTEPEVDAQPPPSWITVTAAIARLRPTI